MEQFGVRFAIPTDVGTAVGSFSHQFSQVTYMAVPFYVYVFKFVLFEFNTDSFLDTGMSFVGLFFFSCLFSLFLWVSFCYLLQFLTLCDSPLPGFATEVL